ncbi:HNH endonuclease [Candidatus Aerophobetes bacterium]|nr:HNH endonuclease [Candidatus Aerophobetes bacterium]
MSTSALQANVLVLNKLWQVVDVCSVKRAVCLLYLKHAQVVVKEGGSFYTFGFEDWQDFSKQSYGDNDFISTINYRLKIPKVIILMLYDKLPPRRVKFTRKNIYLRDNNTCQYCGRKLRTEELNLDHVIPLSRGGKNTWENVVCSCISCNMRKGNKTLQEAGMKLIRKPKKPTWKTFVKTRFPNIPEWENWKDFIDVAYWNIELDED